MAENPELTKSQEKLLKHAQKARSAQVRKILEKIAKNPETSKQVLKGYERGLKRKKPAFNR